VHVTILGSGSPLPDPNRAGPATLVHTSAGALLFDCGRGVLMRAGAAGLGVGALRGLWLTHLHSDHVTDLNDLITMRWALAMKPQPLPVTGPVGTADLVRRTEAMLETDIGYRLAHHEDLAWRPDDPVTEVTDGVVFDEAGVRIVAAPTDHAPVHPTVGYRIEEGGRAVVIAGDTVPCAGLDALCRDADVLVHTVVRPDLIELIGLPRLLDVLDYHSSVQQAAETAQRNGVATLVLTHLVPAPAPTEAAEQPWIDQAAAAFDGTIVVARDLAMVTLDEGSG
jgi:ribonuclease Z